MISESSSITVTVGVIFSVCCGIFYVVSFIWNKVSKGRDDKESIAVSLAEIKTTLNNILSMMATQNGVIHELERRVLELERKSK